MDTTGQSSSDVFQWFSMEGDIDATDVAEHEHVDPEELAEIEQVVSQAVARIVQKVSCRMHNEMSGGIVHRL